MLNRTIHYKKQKLVRVQSASGTLFSFRKSATLLVVLLCVHMHYGRGQLCMLANVF